MGLDINKGDIIATKEGKEMRVLSVYRPGGDIVRVDCIDDHVESPMRTPIFIKDVLKVLKKHEPMSTTPIPLPPEQAVKEKEIIPDDVKDREHIPTVTSQMKGDK